MRDVDLYHIGNIISSVIKIHYPTSRMIVSYERIQLLKRNLLHVPAYMCINSVVKGVKVVHSSMFNICLYI